MQTDDESPCEKSAEYVVPSQLDSVTRILDFISQHGVEVGLTKRQLFEIQLAVDEAVTNVVEHAYEGLDGELKVRCLCRPGVFVVEIHDRGRQFDPTKLPAPDVTSGIKERQIGGLGVHFIRQVMDEVNYRYDPSIGNILRLVKRL